MRITITNLAITGKLFGHIAISPGIMAIQTIWRLKGKRFPDRLLNTHKVHLWAHGGMQQWGVSYWETYTPVVNMLTV